MPLHYPFSAILGCDTDPMGDLGLALILTTISPEIGGVLIRGEKGTAKSTAVRALAAVLPPLRVYADDRFATDPADPTATSPDGPFSRDAPVHTRPVRLVELPVGATEDRVLGSLHLERALAHGKVEFEPGLLARAHRGILYVDEVNLLHDHLVDLLLDASAMGRATVERDGVSVEHASRFVLIGTMNPEEGELRPQLLDRFGLTVDVAAPRDPTQRVEVVRRRMAYDTDPAAFVERYRVADAELTERLVACRERVAHVRLTPARLLTIAKICAAFEVDGMRADIVLARTAIAHATWLQRGEVTVADIRRAALLALPHRRRRNPFDAPGLDEDLLDQLLADAEPPDDDNSPDGSPPPSEQRNPSEFNDAQPDHAAHSSGAQSQGNGDHEPPGAEHADSAHQPQPGEAPDNPGDRDDDLDLAASTQSSTQPHEAPENSAVGSSASPGVQARATTPYQPRLLTVHGVGAGLAGRRSRAITTTGRRIGAGAATGSGSLHLTETLRVAASRRPTRSSGRIVLRPGDLRTAIREGREANLVLFCVDASGSMAARRRMSQVKTAILSLLLDAYQRRDKVGLVTFGRSSARLVLPPTKSVDIAAVRLDEIPAGGRTPLAEGMLEAALVIQRERRRDPRLRPLLIVVTDGRANAGPAAVARSQHMAGYIASLGITTVVVDSESGPLRLGLARTLADHLRAEYLRVTDVTAEALTGAVHARSRVA
ncbi:MAG: VWA domain-containing protein [Actinomycetota bacterium]